MAIIKCHECGNDLSDAAAVCPACGTKTKFASRQDEAKAKRKTIIFVVIGLGLALFVGRIVYIENKNQAFIDSGGAARHEETMRSIEESIEGIRRSQGK